MIARTVHAGMDAVMCAMMNFSQWNLRKHAVTRERLEEYLSDCSRHDVESFYATPEENRSLQQPEWRRHQDLLSWNSPLRGSHAENNTARARIYEAEIPSDATLILVHALMSANDRGYRKIASRFNSLGWNVLFPHLPYHYSRTPKGYANGALAITSDLVRNAETLRQSVIELRQLADWSRQHGSRRIALLGTSYGAWASALTLGLEEIDFAILLQPVADVRHSTFHSPASRMMSILLQNNSIHPELIDRHAHLSSPFGIRPKTNGQRIVVIGGSYDRVSPSSSLKRLSSIWSALFREVPQGHFGYSAMRVALQEADSLIKKPH